MKITLLYFVLLASLISCQTYQYFSLSGTNIGKDSSQQFVVENDTLLLQYNFNGYNGPVKITVYNKTAKPLYIDWKKSAIIIKDKAYSYYSPNQQLNGTTSGSEYRYGNGYNTQNGTIEATIHGQEGIDFIPPNSLKEKSSLSVINGFLKNIPEESMTKQYLWPDKKELPKMRTIDFTEENSPIHLRSYLTFSTSNNEFIMEHQFYISQLFRSMIKPAELTPIQDKGNVFYSSKSTGVGAVVGVAILAGLVVVGSNGDK